MKFKFDSPEEPTLGDTRIVKKFAWFPVYCKDHVVWLESYSSIQQYESVLPWHHGEYFSHHKWREIDRKEIS